MSKETKIVYCSKCGKKKTYYSGLGRWNCDYCNPFPVMGSCRMG